jgi:RecJ-like exonuclease
MRIALSAMGLSSTLVRTFCEEQIFWGTINAARHLPDIMADVVQAAMGYTEVCAQCRGDGNVSGATCLCCLGTGDVRVMGDTHALRLALAMFRIIR